MNARQGGAWAGKAEQMGRLIKAVLVLLVIGLIGLTGYAYLADLSPTQTEVTLPVTLNAGD